MTPLGHEASPLEASVLWWIGLWLLLLSYALFQKKLISVKSMLERSKIFLVKFHAILCIMENQFFGVLSLQGGKALLQNELAHSFPFQFSQEIDEPALIPHIAEASSRRYPYEVLFRSFHKLLMDTATSEYSKNFLHPLIWSVQFNYAIFLHITIYLFFMALSRYLFCDDFFGEESIFYDIFAGIACS